MVSLSSTSQSRSYPVAVYAINEEQLIRVALELGAREFGGPLSNSEQEVARKADAAPSPLLDTDLFRIRAAILEGEDPLGTALCAIRPAEARRLTGAIYTPSALANPMVSWILSQNPERVVDAGAGSGRFTLEIVRRAPHIYAVAIDADPVASLLTRAGLAVLGHWNTRVFNADYTRFELLPEKGPTAFIANPPYVRHHHLSQATKAWAQAAARTLGLNVSGLAGLHAYFFLATALMSRPGDVGCFVTSAEWLDVNYGSIVRNLLLRYLGGAAIHVLKPTAMPFGETATTAAITCFRVGERPKAVNLLQVERAEDVSDLHGGQPVARERLEEAPRWTPLFRTKREVPEGYVELGEICRVHRGAVTGQNSVWITDPHDPSLPEKVLYPSITRARELFAAGETLISSEKLRRVIDLPEDLDELDIEDRRMVEDFLERAKKAGAADGYIARYRKSWWSVGLKPPAPIVASYMARRPPTFVRNLVRARHINIAHGLYPRVELPDYALDRLAAHLRTSISVAQGRTYAGGLTKFEPREMERVPVPDLPALLAQ